MRPRRARLGLGSPYKPLCTKAISPCFRAVPKSTGTGCLAIERRHIHDVKEPQAEGIEHTWLTLGHHEIFSRFTFNREWDVSELSFAKFAAQVTRENSDIIGLPVYASRLFRFASIYVNRNKGI